MTQNEHRIQDADIGAATIEAPIAWRKGGYFYLPKQTWEALFTKEQTRETLRILHDKGLFEYGDGRNLGSKLSGVENGPSRALKISEKIRDVRVSENVGCVGRAMFFRGLGASDKRPGVGCGRHVYRHDPVRAYGVQRQRSFTGVVRVGFLVGAKPKLAATMRHPDRRTRPFADGRGDHCAAVKLPRTGHSGTLQHS